jgi:hypothetical protein
MGWTTEEPRFDYWQGEKIFLYSIPRDRLSVPKNPSPKGKKVEARRLAHTSTKY